MRLWETAAAKLTVNQSTLLLLPDVLLLDVERLRPLPYVSATSPLMIIIIIL